MAIQDLITGVQQVGIGVQNTDAAALYYKELFGMTAKIFDDKSSAHLMTRYTGHKIYHRHAALTMNLGGGGGFEVWQYTDRTPALQPDIDFGDIGIFAVKMKTANIEKAHLYYKSLKGITVSEKQFNTAQQQFFWVIDAFCNRFQIVEHDEMFLAEKFIIAGVCGAVIGVGNIEKSLSFYKNILGGAQVLYETTVSQNYFSQSKTFKTALLKKSKNTNGAFCNLLGDVQIELIELNSPLKKQIFANRYWGDCGFIHLCFDVLNMDLLKTRAGQNGYFFTVDSKESFAMENAAGRFCYVEDPDGTLIELVETHKIAILKKLNWNLDLKKRKGNLPLPKWMIKMLGLCSV